MNEQSLSRLIRLLDQLLEQGHLVDSAWGKTGPGRELCEELCAHKLIELDLKKRWRFRPLNQRALLQQKQQLEEQLKNWQDTQHLPGKARAVARSGNAHSAEGSDHKYYLLNAWKPCEWFHLEDPEQTFDLHQACQFSGPISLTFHPEDDLACDQPLALIENIEPLHHPELMTGREHFGCVLYYQGNLSQSLLNWLTTRRRAPELWLFPDYDYVGLTNYLRIKDKIPDIQLFVPDALESRLRNTQQGCSQRTEDQYKQINLERLHQSEDPQVQRVLAIIQETGKGLDQKSLLIGNEIRT